MVDIIRMVISNPAEGDENVDQDIWLKRQFTWNPDEFGGDIDATVEAWYDDVISRFQSRTGFSFNNVYTVGTFSNYSNMRDVVKAAMRYRIENETKNYSGSIKGRIDDSRYTGPGSRVFDELVSASSPGLRPGEYRRPLISAADSALKEGFIRRAIQLINNTEEFLTKHPVTGLPINTNNYALRFNLSYPDGFIRPVFERQIETITEVEGTDMNSLPLEVVVEYAVLSAILDKQGVKVNPGMVFGFIGNLDNSKKGEVAKLAAPLMSELGYAKGLEPVATLEEIQEQFDLVVAEYGIQAGGQTVSVETVVEENVPVMKLQIQDLRSPMDSTVEYIRLEDFFTTHRASLVLQEQIARLLPPVAQLPPDLYPNIGGTTANGWRQIGGRSSTYIIKFTRDPLDLLCISTGRAGSVPNQNGEVSGENGVEGYTYHLEVEDENGQMVVREFRSSGWRSCQGLRCGSTSSYASGPYEGVAYGECVIYLYPDDPNGWDRSKPIARLYLRWGFKDWHSEGTRATQSANQTLNQRGRQWNEFAGGSDFNPGGANEPVILWEPRPYPASSDTLEMLKSFFNSAWEICTETYRSTGVGPSHQTFTIASTPYRINGFSDITGTQNISASWGGSAIPRFSLQYSGGALEDLGGQIPDYSHLQDPLITEELAMSASSDITERPEAYEALATNATIWLYPAVCQNMRSAAVGMPALQMMASSSFALPTWLTSVMNGSGVRLDEYYSEPWKSQNLVASITQNPQIFFDPVDGTDFRHARKIIANPAMSFSMHGHRYIYRNFGVDSELQGEYPASIQLIFRDNPELTSFDIGSAFELFYLGVLHPSNNIDPNSSPTTPFISCLPAGDERIERGSPELRNMPIGVEAAVADFLSGKITQRLRSTLELRTKLRGLIGYGVDLDVLASRSSSRTSTATRPDEIELYETMIVWRNLITSPWLSQEGFESMLSWYTDTRNEVYARSSGDDGLQVYIMELQGRKVLELWQSPFTSSDSRGFKNETGFVSSYQGSHNSWRNYGWQERQSAYFTKWAYEWFADRIGMQATELSVIERFLNTPIESDGTTFAPAIVRTQEAFDTLYQIMFSSTFTENVGVDLAPVYRYCLLFSPISNTNVNEPLLLGISGEEGGFLTLQQYQNLLTEALEDEGLVVNIISLFQYDFLPRSTHKRFRATVPDEIQGQLLERGAQVGYNLISSFLRFPNRIRAYANQMTAIALGDLYPQYVETGEWPSPPEDGNVRRYLRDNNMKLTTLVSAAVGGGNNEGGLARNIALPADVADLLVNGWFDLAQKWRELNYARYLDEINSALAENVATPTEILTSIYNENVGLQEKIANNPNCDFSILMDIFGLIEDEGDIKWADDASPISALMNPGLGQEDYTTLYYELKSQLERDARSMDESKLVIPTCFQIFDNVVEQFYEYNEGSQRTGQITSLISETPSLRYWRGGSDKGSFSGNIAGGEGNWLEYRWPGINNDESCARTWRFGVGGGGNNDGFISGLTMDGSASEANVTSEGDSSVAYSTPFVLIKYNTPRASGRGDGHQSTCATYGDKPIVGKSTFGEMLFVQRLYKREIGRGELRQNDDGSWVGRRFVWSFDGYYYDEDGVKKDGITYAADSLDDLFGWLGEDRYDRIGFGEGRDGLKWSQGVVVCITDEMIMSLVDEGLNPFQEFFGDATESAIAPVPLWRANWSSQDSLNLVRSMLNKDWFLDLAGSPDTLNLASLRDELRVSPLRIYRPGAEPGTEPMLNVSTIMTALDQPDATNTEISFWNEGLVEFLAWDILQGGYDTFSDLKNLTLSINTPSIFIPLLNSNVVTEAWLSEDELVRDYAIRTSEANPANVLNIILAEFGVDIDYLVDNGVWTDAFQGTTFLSGSRGRRNMINHLLNYNKYKKILPIEFLTSIYTVHSVNSSYIGDSNVSATSSLRNVRLEEFQRAYARERLLIIELLKNYSREGTEYALGLISVGDGIGDPLTWSCFEDRVFVEATLEGRRFDGNARRWPGYILNNRAAYIDRLMVNRESMVGMMTKQELRDLMLNVNYNCEFANRVILPMFDDLLDQLVDDFDGIEEEAEAASIILIRSQLDSLVGEDQADVLLDVLDTPLTSVDFSFLGGMLGPENWLDLEDFIDVSYTSGPVQTPLEE